MKVVIPVLCQLQCLNISDRCVKRERYCAFVSTVQTPSHLHVVLFPEETLKVNFQTNVVAFFLSVSLDFVPHVHIDIWVGKIEECPPPFFSFDAG